MPILDVEPGQINNTHIGGPGFNIAPNLSALTSPAAIAWQDLSWSTLCVRESRDKQTGVPPVKNVRAWRTPGAK